MKDYFKNIFVLADIHGKHQPVRNLYLRNKEKYKIDHPINNALILLGDTGANYFFNYRDEDLKKKLSSYPFTYFIIRGNHEERPSICMQENPNDWDTEEFWGGLVYVEKAFPNLKYADDNPAVYNIPYITGYNEGTAENDYNDEGNPFFDFYKTLVLPGAYSVDKYYRLSNGWSWFPQEQMTKEEKEKAWNIIDKTPNKKFNLILSHTSPIIYEPTDLFLSCVDQSTVDKDTERFLGAVEYAINYDLWLWGHYHATRVYPLVEEKQPIMLFNDESLYLTDYIQEDYKEITFI